MRERRYIFKISPSLNNLVDNVRFGESWVVLDDGLDSLAGSWGRWDYGSWGSSNWCSVWVSSITSSIWVSSGIWVSSIAKSVKTSISKSSISKSVKTSISESSVWESSWDSSWEESGGSWGRSLFTGCGFSNSSKVFSLGSSYFRGILNWFWESVFMDWGNAFENWGNGEVGGLDTEAKTISDVVDSLDETVGIGVAVR